jgi:hypothetical protein
LDDKALASDVEATTARLTTKIKAAYPAVKHLFIEVKAGEVKAGEVKAAAQLPPVVSALTVGVTPVALSPKAAGRPPETKKQKGRKKRR